MGRHDFAARSRMVVWSTFLAILISLGVVHAQAVKPSVGESRFVDHSLLVAPEYPCTWPAFPFPRFQLSHQRIIGRDSAYNIDTLYIDGNTGTQLDVPPHSVVRPDLKREKSGPLGLAFTDKIEAWQFGGEHRPLGPLRPGAGRAGLAPAGRPHASIRAGLQYLCRIRACARQQAQCAVRAHRGLVAQAGGSGRRPLRGSAGVALRRRRTGEEPARRRRRRHEDLALRHRR